MEALVDRRKLALEASSPHVLDNAAYEHDARRSEMQSRVSAAFEAYFARPKAISTQCYTILYCAILCYAMLYYTNHPILYYAHAPKRNLWRVPENSQAILQ